MEMKIKLELDLQNCIESHSEKKKKNDIRCFCDAASWWRATVRTGTAGALLASGDSCLDSKGHLSAPYHRQNLFLQTGCATWI